MLITVKIYLFSQQIGMMIPKYPKGNLQVVNRWSFIYLPQQVKYGCKHKEDLVW